MTDEAPAHGRDPVAIVGIGCALPGATDVTELWEMLVAHQSTIGEIPAERFDIDAWYDPTPGVPGRISTRWGGFLPDVDQFDAPFFGMSPHEADRLDPQHRLMLRTTWEAIEDAGLSAERLAGTATGVYTSCLAADYWDNVRGADMFDMDAATGTGGWGLPSGRISRLLDLRGPSMGVEATCATALLAVHLGCQDLWSGRTVQAIVSSANLLLGPDLYFSLSESEILSPTGRSCFGESTADGYVRSEGAVTVVLKPLSHALRDGDRVYAAIIGTGVNNNGRTNATMLAPGVDGQRDMLRAALRDAGVRPADVDYVEAHGAGTPRGDDVELTALHTVLGEGRPAERPCLTGSIKSNIGHAEAAAGLAGLVKAALAIRHRTIPASLGVERPHPLLAAGTPLALASMTRPWPETGRPAIAGVSSFGLSATNVHVVLSEVTTADVTPAAAPSTVLLPLSARDPGALRTLAERYADLLDGPERVEPAQVAYQAATRRTHHDLRLAVVGGDRGRLARDLRAFAAGQVPDSVRLGTAGPGLPRVVFVYPGQGAQWPGMGRRLLADPVFHRQMVECDEAIRAEVGWSLIDLLSDARPLLTEDVVQPALWAVQLGLSALWRSWGFRPDLVLGHSLGEVAAACVTGALTVRDGAAVVCRRSALIRTLEGPGEMWAVQLGEDLAREACRDVADLVSVGVVNSDHATVLAGGADAVRAVVERLTARGVYCRQVRVRYASHSPQVEPLRSDLLTALADLRPRAGTVPMYSTVHDREVTGTELDADYWMANLREPVRFASAMRHALADGRPVVFVEISAHPLLTGAMEDTIESVGAPAVVVTSLVKDEDERESMLTGLAGAHVHGCAVDWSSVVGPHGHLDLPHYPWQGRRHWVDGRPAAAPAAPTQPVPDTFTVDQTWTGPATPLAVGLSLVHSALHELTEGAPTVLENLRVPSVGRYGSGALQARTVLSREPDGWRFEVSVASGGAGALEGWTTYASGRARPATPRPRRVEPLDQVRDWCAEPVPYPAASGFVSLTRRSGESLGMVADGGTPHSRADLLDLAVRVLHSAVPGGVSVVGAGGRAIEVAEVTVPDAVAGKLWVHARIRHADPTGRVTVGDVRVLDEECRPVGELHGLAVSDAADTTLFRSVPAVARAVHTGPARLVPAGVSGGIAASPVATATVAASPPAAGYPDSTGRIVDIVAHLLHLSPDDIDHALPLPDLGVDSVLAARLRGRLTRELGVQLPIRHLLDGRTIAELASDLDGRRALADRP
ncbi:acyltransferase domain-containing protein [Micromonospora sp. NPDC049171]|uniref:type I polyketide synthase n=1 Tax=Micromonospora sp. NPDC049171 TaxID=3155770 RepID=UPI0033CEB8CB